jgi:hypothetical protein
VYGKRGGRTAIDDGKDAAQVGTAPAAKLCVIGILRSALWTKHSDSSRGCTLLPGQMLRKPEGRLMKEIHPVAEAATPLLRKERCFFRITVFWPAAVILCPSLNRWTIPSGILRLSTRRYRP